MTDTIIPTSLHDPRLARRTAVAWCSGGALWLVAGLLHGESGWRFDTSSVVWLAADVLIAIGIVGLLGLRPHGTSRTGAVALCVALAARFVLATGEIATLIQGTDDNPFIPIGALLTALSLTVLGVIVLRRGRVGGARRWAFLAMGLYPFVAMFPFVAVSGEPNFVLIALWGLPAVAIGAASSGAASWGAVRG